MVAKQNLWTKQQQLTTLSTSRNADNEHLHLRCKKGVILNALTWIEPFKFALGGIWKYNCYMRAANWYTPLNTVWYELGVMWNNPKRCNNSAAIASNHLSVSSAIICSSLSEKLRCLEQRQTLLTVMIFQNKSHHSVGGRRKHLFHLDFE